MHALSQRLTDVQRQLADGTAVPGALLAEPRQMLAWYPAPDAFVAPAGDSFATAERLETRPGQAAARSQPTNDWLDLAIRRSVPGRCCASRVSTGRRALCVLLAASGRTAAAVREAGALEAELAAGRWSINRTEWEVLPPELVERLTDRGAFKTPTLREIHRTAPYMHDGSLATIKDVIDFYDRGGNSNPSLDPAIRPLGLSIEEKRALGAFLRSLTGEVRTSQHLQER